MRTTVLAVLLLAVMAAFDEPARCATGPKANNQTITGHLCGIVRDIFREPVSGLEVSIFKDPDGAPFKAVQTGADGTFDFGQLAAGTYWIGFVATNYDNKNEITVVNPTDSCKDRLWFDADLNNGNEPESFRPSGKNHPEVLDSAIRAVRAGKIELKNGTRVNSKQVDKVLENLVKLAGKANDRGKASAPVASNELISYEELFSGIDDDVLFPLTRRVISYAPGSTFVGLTFYDKNGRAKGQITGKTREDSPADVDSVCWTVLTTNNGSIPWGVREDTNLVRWGNIKRGVAVQMVWDSHKNRWSILPSSSPGPGICPLPIFVSRTQ